MTRCALRLNRNIVRTASIPPRVAEPRTRAESQAFGHLRDELARPRVG